MAYPTNTSIDRHAPARHPAGTRARASVAIALLVALLVACTESITPDPDPPDPDPPAASVELAPVAPGFVNPVSVTNAGDGSGRLFVAQRRGLVYAVDGASVQETPYLDVSALLGDQAGENGLLGLTFHPEFATNGRLFVHFTDDARGNVIAELQADPPNADEVDAATLVELLRVETTTDFHVGGHVAFGPDGYLYAALGDGGNPPAAQDLDDPYGGLLRLDVSTPGVASVPPTNPFVDDAGAFAYTWVHGLRNPWRFSFDADTGDLWIADVGEDAVEEINVVPEGSDGGQNFGWPIMEGDVCYTDATCDTSGLTLPDFVYTHASGWGRSVTGGYVYRGSAIPDLVGSYVFGDFITGDLFVVPSGTDGTDPERLLETSVALVSFGVDEEDELLVVDYVGGGLYRVVPTTP